MEKSQIDAEIRALADVQSTGGHPLDEEFNPNDQNIDTGRNQILPDSLGNLGTGGSADKYPKSPTELKIIDELLVSVPRAQGYYLKLYKEIGPNELELKQRINDYEHWGDLEWEITKLVREYTKKSPRKWGSAKYVIIVWNDKGMRGEKRPPIPIYVDAQENENDPNLNRPEIPTVEEKISEFTQLTKAIGAMNPVVNPADQVKMMQETFKAGQEAAGAKQTGEANAIAAMMTGMIGMMTQMMTAMKPAAPVQDPIMMMLLTKLLGNGDNGNSSLKMIGELRAAGLIPDKKDTGLASELDKMLQLKEVAEAFGGGGTSGGDDGIIQTLIKQLGPKVPEMIGNVTQTVNKVVDFNKKKLEAMQTLQPGQPKTNTVPGTVKAVESPEQLKAKENEKKMKIFLKILTDKLYLYVSNKNYASFDDVSDKLKLLTHGQPILTDAIKQGSVSKDDMVKIIMQYDPEHYQYDNERQLLDEYVIQYMQYLKEENIKKPPFIAICPECNMEYSYDTEQDYLDDLKDCESCGNKNILIPKTPEMDNIQEVPEEIHDETPISASVEINNAVVE